MRIGMILDSKYPPDPRVENEAIALINNGHDVFLLALDYSRQQEKSELINGIRVERVFPPKLIYKLSALAYTIPLYHLYFYFVIKNFLKKNKIESIHIHDIQISRSVFWANRSIKLPIVQDLHENRPEIMKFYAHVKSFSGKLLIHPKTWKKFEYKYIRKAKKVIVVTENAARYYMNELNISRDKFSVVPNSVKESFYKDAKIEEDIIKKYSSSFSILYLGETGERRGLEVAIKSIHLLKDKIPNLKLCVVGKSSYDKQLKQIIEKEKIGNYVDMHGWQDFGLFPSYIQSCQIGICPLHRNIHHDTTYANKIIQTLSFGKPMIVSNSDAQKDLIEKYDCGLVFEDRNIEDFVKKVLDIYQNQKLYSKLSINATTAVEKHLKWEILSEELVKTYQNYERN
jgi:glycosyltransferase involved in cell wall biosynthesis